MGVVFEAEHLRLRQPIAIKFLNPTMLGVAEIVQRFDREARAAATLRSRHVVRVTDVEQTPEGVPYMVMELLEGGDLEAQREQRGRLPYPEAVDYVLQACGALVEAHDAGIVHRDLKPGNLFLAREDADRVVIKILDFGISKFMNDEDVKLTSAGAIMGTALYMSPEQIRGDISIDGRSDIWSLGVILYELIGGNAPWLGPTTRVAAGVVSEAAPDLRRVVPLPEGLAQAIHSMLEKDPSKRPQSISDLVFAIAPFASPGSVGAEVAEHLARRSQRNLGQVTRASSSSPSSPSPISNPTPSSSSSDRIQLVVSTRANPERSTMAATTTSMNMMIARPRMWGALAAFGVLALAGATLIAFVIHKSPDRGEGNASNPPATSRVAATSEPRFSALQADGPPAAEPPSPVSKASEPMPPPTSPTPPTSATAALSASASGLVHASDHRPPGPAVGVKRPPTGPNVGVTPTKPPPPTAKPAEPNAPINPPFLK
jgi:eukaryotic-like serine/threonine-protein kinase